MKLMKFSENLRRLIQAKGLKLKSISSETGIPMSTLSEWTGGREPKVSEALVRLSEYLGVSLDELVRGRVSETGERVLTESYFQIGGKTYSLRVCEPKSEIEE